MLCASPKMRAATWAPQRRSRPRRRPCKGEREVRPSRRNRSRSLVRLEPSCAVNLSPRFASTTLAAPSVRSQLFVSAGPSSSMGRCDCRESCSWLAKCCSKSIIISYICLSYFSVTTLRGSSHVGWPDPNFSCWGTRPLPSGTASLSFHSMLGKLQY